MITLFENITEQLTELEKNTLVPLLVKTLQITNETKRMKAQNLINYLSWFNYDVSEARIRKMVAYIRIMNLTKPKALIGAHNGYFITDDIRVLDDQIKSLQGRVDAISNVLESMKAQKQNLVREIIKR